MYAARTQEEILSELQDWTNAKSAKTEGTFAYDVLSSNSIEFQKVELELAECYQNAFGHTAQGDYLELKAAESGIYRKAAKKSVGKLEIIGNGTIRAGAIFTTAGGIRFIATETTQIEGSGIIDIEAETAGSAGNVAANTITQIPMSIAGIRSCNNPSECFDGFDEEDDETLRERYLQKVRYPAQAGNPRSYIMWALEVVGVGAVRVQRCWAGAGTVRVVVVDSNMQAANVDLIERVWTHIEVERPIGAIVSVISAIPKKIDIAANVKGAIDVEAFKRGVTKYLTNFTNQTLVSFDTNSSSGEISIAQIGSYIIAEGGADDYDVASLTLNGENRNISLGIEEIPVLGKVEFQ